MLGSSWMYGQRVQEISLDQKFRFGSFYGGWIWMRWFRERGYVRREKMNFQENQYLVFFYCVYIVFINVLILY